MHYHVIEQCFVLQVRAISAIYLSRTSLKMLTYVSNRCY